jgi:hypothetical protein
LVSKSNPGGNPNRNVNYKSNLGCNPIRERRDLVSKSNPGGNPRSKKGLKIKPLHFVFNLTAQGKNKILLPKRNITKTSGVKVNKSIKNKKNKQLC